MKITTKQLLQSFPALARLASKEPQGTTEEAFQFVYDLRRVYKSCKEAHETQAEAQERLYRGYGAKDTPYGLQIDFRGILASENGNGEAKVAEIKSALAAFDAVEVEIWEKTFTKANLMAAKISPPSGADADALEWLLIEP